MGPDTIILVFWMLNFKPSFPLSSFTFIKRLFSFSSFSAIRVVLSVYLRLLIFLPVILIPACASSSPVFLVMYSAYKLNKQGDNIQPWSTTFLIWSQSVVPCPVLTVASWPCQDQAGQVIWYSHLRGLKLKFFKCAKFNININVSHNRAYVKKKRQNNVFSSLRCLAVPKEPQPCLFFTTLSLWQGELKRDDAIKGKGMKLAWWHVLWGASRWTLRVFRSLHSFHKLGLGKGIHRPQRDELCLPSLAPLHKQCSVKGIGPTQCRKTIICIMEFACSRKRQGIFKLSLSLSLQASVIASCHLC